MTEFGYKKLAIFILLGMIMSVTREGVCYASSFDDLRAVKREAWKQCEWNRWGISADYREALREIDGAVGSDGAAYMTVMDWEHRAIPKAGDVPVFGSEMSDAVIGMLQEDSIVRVVEPGEDRTLIQSGYTVGYVDSGRLFYKEEAEERADDVCPEMVLTDRTDVGAYKSPKDTEVLCYLQQRQGYDVIETVSDWYRISMDYFEETYVKSSDIKLVRKVHFATAEKGDLSAKSYREVELSDTDRKLLAAITWCEAGSDPFEGQVAVASTVLNRVESDVFPDTVEEVIRQEGQFIPVESGWYDEVLKDPKQVKDSCFEAVDYVLQGNRMVDTCYFDQAGKGKKIGSHWFY